MIEKEMKFVERLNKMSGKEPPTKKRSDDDPIIKLRRKLMKRR